MKSFWLFRSNLRQFESYHKYNILEEFEKNCWDFYLIQGLWFLRNNLFDEIVIWRLVPKNVSPFEFVFIVNNKKFIQRFVSNFNDCLKYPKPFVTFWRGGFKEYDDITKKHYDFFKPNSLYCATGKRIIPIYNGKYDSILIEDENDFNKDFNCILFYKTSSETIFTNLNIEPKYDLYFSANFTQYNYKGQEFLINEISKSEYLKSLKVVHIGNKSEMGIELCKKYKVDNIKFLGYISDKKDVNKIINKSKFGIVCSNKEDGCPRIITEILLTGTPLIIRNITRLLNYYKKDVVSFEDNEIEIKIKNALDNFKDYKIKAMININNFLMKKICMLNYNLWTKKISDLDI